MKTEPRSKEDEKTGIWIANCEGKIFKMAGWGN